MKLDRQILARHAARHPAATTRTPRRQRRLRSPFRQGVLLVAIYVALYGSVGLLVHVSRVLAAAVAASVTPVMADAVPRFADGAAAPAGPGAPSAPTR